MTEAQLLAAILLDNDLDTADAGPIDPDDYEDEFFDDLIEEGEEEE